ncbi:TetR/AcrR family transcriptional regulator [Streptomyces sp. Ru87]|uniref:TetR/AcrR family transcriptional regulator n=1 Tax=Streptomyces sp. Ru87 TaxID=2044307 RepID=UPI000BF74BF5|nr:TetR family transcriptional regulator [Streptomyces sp. Ru87]PGH47541.1 TetR family transcriptional regulator [Streptomyces sp. Ru87]
MGSAFSPSEDRTARAVIRDEALRLFAAHGPGAVTMRQVGAAAGVSAALVVHHFGSKEGLREAVDSHVLATFEAMLGELAGEGGAVSLDSEAAGSLGEAFLRHLPPDSPMPAYLRWLLLSGGEAGHRLFGKLFELSRATLDAMVAGGTAAPGRDPAARAVFLLLNDLAVLLLHDHAARVLGFDPLSADGMARWAPEMLSVYTGGLTASPADPGPGPDSGPDSGRSHAEGDPS